MSPALEAPVGLREGLFRPTCVEIDLESLRWNLDQIKAKVPSRTHVLAVVKANAYGHGAVEVSQALFQAGAGWAGVSGVEEGLALRSAGFEGRILLLGTSFPFESFDAAVGADLTPTVASVSGLQTLSEAVCRLGKSGAAFHLKIETGMGRIGISPTAATEIFEQLVTRAPTVRLGGLYTHFSSADSDSERTRQQLALLQGVVQDARNRGLRDFLVHAANSAAIFSYPDSHLDMVRPGLSLYGISPWDKSDERVSLRPVLSWRTRVAFVKSVPKGTPVSYGGAFRTSRPSRIATLPVGYADGYRREMSNRGQVLIRGRRCPVIGRVTMDHIMVDVSDLSPAVDAGEEVVLIGRQGGEEVSTWDLARDCGTIPYEILCGISQRVPRFLKDPA